MEASDKEMTTIQNAKHTGSECERYYPDYFPGTVKPSASVEGNLFYCELACVQESLQMIPRAKPLFGNIIQQLESPGGKKISEIIDSFNSIILISITSNFEVNKDIFNNWCITF